MRPKSSTKLEKLHEFAKKGTHHNSWIGKCIATRDTLANTQADLMFYSGEVITILKHLKDDVYLGYCEGVIGRFHGKDVSFNYGQSDTQKSDGRITSVSPDISTSDDGDKGSQGAPHIVNFLSPSDAERAIQMRSRSSSISSLELDSEKNTPSTSVPSSPVLTPAINITPSSTYDDVSITPPTLSEHLHNKDVQNSSSSFNSNPDKSQTSQRETPQISNDQLSLSNRAQSDSPLSLNNRPAISFHSQNVFPSSSNQIRKMSSPFPSSTRLSQLAITKRNNSAPPLTNDDETGSKALPHDNSESSALPLKQKSEPSISDDQIRPAQSNNIVQISDGHAPATLRSKYNPGVGGIVDSPTSSPNSSPRVSSDISATTPNESPNSVQLKGRSRAVNQESGSRPVHSRQPSASNMAGTLPRPSLRTENSKIGGTHSNHSPVYSTPLRTFGQSQLSPVISEFSLIIPPQRKSSIGLPSELSSVSSRPQVMNFNDRCSPSTTPLPSPVSQKSRFPSDLSGTIKANQVVMKNQSSPPAPCVPQIFVGNEDIMDNDSSSADKSTSTVPLVSIDQEPPMPTFMIEAANDTDDFSSEDEDEEPVKSEDIPSSQSKKDKVLAVDEYGFVHDVAEKEGADGIQKIIKTPGRSEKNSRTIRLYRERESKWVYFLGNMDPALAKESKKIKKLVRLGIPESVRGKSWQLMAGVHKYRKAGVYEVRFSVTYQLCKREKLPIYDVIERDISR
ncbi:17316_t:CDS:2, partial [Acaulospora colombiana]